MKLEQLRKLSNEQLNERFPFMVSHNIFDGHICKDDDGKVLNDFYSSWGWRDIQLVLAEHIKPIYDKRLSDKEKENFFLTEVKEKYGTLRYYWSASSEDIDNWTNLAEHISSYTCINCGETKKKGNKFVYWESKGWISPYCKSCAKFLSYSNGNELFWRKNYNKTNVKSQTILERYGCGPKMTITINDDEFWKLEEDE